MRTAAAYLALVFSVIALGMQFRDRLASYLTLKLSLEQRDNATIVTTCVDNPSPRPRTMTKVFLLVGPEAENPVETFNSLLAANGKDVRACCAIDFEFIDLPSRLTDDSRHRLLMPLDYYIEENPEIGDEALSCQTSIAPGELVGGQSYGVRFFVFGHRWRRARVHRKVHAILAVPGDPSPVRSAPPRQLCRGHRGCHLGLTAPEQHPLESGGRTAWRPGGGTAPGLDRS